MDYKKILVLSAWAYMLGACGGGSHSSSSVDEVPLAQSPQQPAPDPRHFDISVLMMGNSHTLSHGLPNMLESLLKAYNPNGTFLVEVSPESQFLYLHRDSQTTLDLLHQRDWSHTILQAQRYSQSQSADYPTEAAQDLIRMTKAQQGTPILFPEWGQRGRDWESQYVYDLHSDIANREAACVAPVGFAWDMTLNIQPDMVLHAEDGNHATRTGAFLTALVLFETITGSSADQLAAVEGLGIPARTQDFLGQMASQAVADYPPCTRLE